MGPLFWCMAYVGVNAAFTACRTQSEFVPPFHFRRFSFHLKKNISKVPVKTENQILKPRRSTIFPQAFQVTISSPGFLRIWQTKCNELVTVSITLFLGVLEVSKRLPAIASVCSVLLR